MPFNVMPHMYMYITCTFTVLQIIEKWSLYKGGICREVIFFDRVVLKDRVVRSEEDHCTLCFWSMGHSDLTKCGTHGNFM